METFRTCDAYCKKMSLVCVEAAEEIDNSCRVEKIHGCGTDMGGFTSDALCKCAGSLSDDETTDPDRATCPNVFNSEKKFLQNVQMKPFGQDDEPGFSSDLSGLAASKQKDGGSSIVWVVNDEKSRIIHAANPNTGERLCSYLLPTPADQEYVVRKGDIEGLSLGPCSRNGGRCLYVALTGNGRALDCADYIPGQENNLKNCRDEDDFAKVLQSARIYKMREPRVSKCPPSKKVLLAPSRITTIRFDYRHDDSPREFAAADSFFVDWTGDTKTGRKGDLYLITRWSTKKDAQEHTWVRLYKIPASDHDALPYGEETGLLSPRPYDLVSLREDRHSGADMTRDGTLVAVRSRSYVLFWTRDGDETVAEALGKQRCSERHRTPESEYDAFEGVAFLPNRRAFFETADCKTFCDAPMFYTKYQ
eukprot:CAMPEP_0194281534 /NCGR_PEP_ID=MMETSP0169-20130528/20905_1 /TAXON_ID=218684 /ORGANISM="Corethron pennatum, Strain L29A3" /LENGTH=419 /DNA_ID=CAMNT_0039026611 /DNA_START=233 /DNA_END=1492 /DNA_ORIENTATION=+